MGVEAIYRSNFPICFLLTLLVRSQQGKSQMPIAWLWNTPAIVRPSWQAPRLWSHDRKGAGAGISRTHHKNHSFSTTIISNGHAVINQGLFIVQRKFMLPNTSWFTQFSLFQLLFLFPVLLHFTVLHYDNFKSMHSYLPCWRRYLLIFKHWTLDTLC